LGNKYNGDRKALESVRNLESGNEKTNFLELGVMFGENIKRKLFSNIFFFAKSN